MAIDRAPWTALVDDDGSNLVGTIWNKDKIKTVLLDPIDAMPGSTAGVWTATPGVTIQNDVGTVLTATIAVNRHRKLGGNTIAWNFAVTAITLPGPSTNLYVFSPTFALLGPTGCAYSIAWANFPAFLKFIHSTAISALKNDGSVWAAGTHAFYFNILLEGSGG